MAFAIIRSIDSEYIPAWRTQSLRQSPIAIRLGPPILTHFVLQSHSICIGVVNLDHHHSRGRNVQTNFHLTWSLIYYLDWFLLIGVRLSSRFKTKKEGPKKRKRERIEREEKSYKEERRPTKLFWTMEWQSRWSKSEKTASKLLLWGGKLWRWNGIVYWVEVSKFGPDESTMNS